MPERRVLEVVVAQGQLGWERALLPLLALSEGCSSHRSLRLWVQVGTLVRSRKGKTISLMSSCWQTTMHVGTRLPKMQWGSQMQCHHDEAIVVAQQSMAYHVMNFSSVNRNF